MSINVTRQDHLVGNKTKVLETTWSITFFNAPWDLPPLVIAHNHLEGAYIHTRRVVEANRVGGGFAVSYGPESSALLPFDASADDVASALASISTFTDPVTGKGGTYQVPD